MLDQACAHCPIFPTAASRRSLDRVSVPVWLIILSDQLPIDALVSLYPTNKLIGRRLLQRRLAAFSLKRYAVLASVSQRCPPSLDTFLRVTHPSATNARKHPCDLHVLSIPPAFALSQDQTLRFIIIPPLQQNNQPNQILNPIQKHTSIKQHHQTKTHDQPPNHGSHHNQRQPRIPTRIRNLNKTNNA